MSCPLGMLTKFKLQYGPCDLSRWCATKMMAVSNNRSPSFPQLLVPVIWPHNKIYLWSPSPWGLPPPDPPPYSAELPAPPPDHPAGGLPPTRRPAKAGDAPPKPPKIKFEFRPKDNNLPSCA